MKRLIALLAIVTLLAIVAVALSASAQTNPPNSGDWIIGDSTTFSGGTITLPASVRIIGSGHLSLTDVDIRFTGITTHEITLTTNARFTVKDGTMTSGGSRFSISSAGRLSMDGCNLTNTDGITITSWRTQVTNCTIDRSGSSGILVNAPDSGYAAGLDISHNHIINASGYGIRINVPSLGPSTDVRVICYGNNVTESNQDGIFVSASTDAGRFFMKQNEAYRNGGHGIYANLDVRVVGFRLDDSWAKNNTQDGVRLIVDCSIYHTKYLDRVTSIGNGGQGVYIVFESSMWDRPVFKNWYIDENDVGGMYFDSFICATLENSYNVNDGAQADYTAVNTVLEIYGTTHRKAMARVSGGAYTVTSWRYLDFTATWQNSMPCSYNTVVFENSAGDQLFRPYTADIDGWLGNHSEREWVARETQSFTIHSFTAFLVGGQQRVTGPVIDFNRDFKEELRFFDDQPPDLTVITPSTNHVQNTDNLTIKGTCMDAHSHARVVQVSFDPEPLWHRKVWINASGTSVWDLYMDPAMDSIYTIFVRAYDWANYPNGIYANITITNVTVDTTAPELTIIQPPPNSITNNTQTTILGTTDPDVVTLTINGEFMPFYGSTFNKAINLNEGNNTLVIIATDYAGNIAKEVRYILLDSIAPIVVVSHPRDGLRTNKPSYVMGGYSDLEGATMRINGNSVPIENGIWTHTVDLLKGNNVIVIDAEDIAKNHRVVHWNIYYDPDPPVITVRDPEDGEIINTSMFVLDGFTDVDVLYDQITVNNISIAIDGMGNFETNVTIVEEGSFDLVIFAVDEAGNEATRTIPLIIDLTAPYITNMSLKDGDIVNTRILSVTGETEVGTTLYIEGKVVLVIDGYFQTEINLDEGENYVTLRVTDEAGNFRVVGAIITLDTLAPQVFLDGVLNEIAKTKESFYTVVGITEATANVMLAHGPDGITYYAEEVYVNEKGEFSHPVILGGNKTTYISIVAMDYAGNGEFTNFTIKQEEKEVESFYSANTGLVWGILILVVVLIIAYPLTRMYVDNQYERRLKKMGIGPTAPMAPPPGMAPTPPPQMAPPPGQAPPGPAPAPQPQQPPRPPRPDEAPPAPPRPPRDDE